MRRHRDPEEGGGPGRRRLGAHPTQAPLGRVKLHYPPGATPLEPEDLEDLLVEVTTQGELDRAEARNIIKAVQWAKGNTRLRKELLMVSGLLRLHEHILGETWRWAGQYRNKNTNIGTDFPLIREEVPRLCGDATYWVESDTYPWPELAIRFHQATRRTLFAGLHARRRERWVRWRRRGGPCLCGPGL